MSKIVPPSMLLKAAIMSRVESERGLFRTPTSKRDFALAPGAVVLRAVRILKSCPCVVFDSKLVQNSWMCTPFNGGGRMNFTIKILQSHEFYNQEIVKSWKSLSRFSWPWLQRRASCPLVPSGLGPARLGQTNVLWAGPRIIHKFFNGWINILIDNCLIQWWINCLIDSLKKEDSDLRFVNNDLHTTSTGQNTRLDLINLLIN